MLQQLPGGLCFAHGPYEDGFSCPRWPKCVTDPSKDEYFALAARRKKNNACLRAAEILEEADMLDTTVQMLRSVAEAYK